MTEAKAKLKAADALVASVQGALSAYITQGGRVVSADGSKEWVMSTQKGRESGPSAKELRDAGLDHLVKTGSSFSVPRWRKIRT